MQIQSSQVNGVEYLYSKRNSSVRPPIIFVHGAYNDARAWLDHFFPFFYETGYSVFAIHLKRTRDLKSIQTLFKYSLSTYVKRLDVLIQSMDQKPVLIGHSMGGLIIQKYLSSNPQSVHGACLLASLPPFGMKHTIGKMLRKPRVLLKYFILTLAPAVAKKYPPPEGIISNRVDPEFRNGFGKYLVRESMIALTQCLIPGIKVEKVKQVPLVIFGAGHDHLALMEDVVKTADIYQKVPHLYPEMGHFMMMEPEWQEICETIEKELLASHVRE